MDLQQWAERVLRTVEQDGANVAVVKLVTTHDGAVWNTWHPPWGEPSDWTAETTSYLRSLEQQWPSRVVPIVFVAETATGETLSQLPMTVTGKAKAGTLDAGAAAASVAFDNLANTIEKMQRLVNTQLDAARRTAEVNANVIEQQTHLIRLYREREMMSPGGSGESTGLDKLVEDNAPAIVNMLGELVSRAGTKG